MESCSWNHFKTFFYEVLSTPDVRHSPGPVLALLKVSRCWLFALGICLGRDKQSKTWNHEVWEHCELSSHVLYVLCMYVCILLLLPRGSDGMVWGEGGANLREGKCFNFSSDLVASPSSALSYGTLKVFHMAHLDISRIIMKGFQWEFRKEREDSEMVQWSSPRSSQLTSLEHMELAWERVQKGGVAGPDQTRTPSSACCQVALPGAAGRLPGWPLASGLPPRSVTWSDIQVGSTENQVFSEHFITHWLRGTIPFGF